MAIELFNEDCLIGMARYPDKYFDLAVVDPPYGLGNKLSVGGKAGTKSTVKFHQRYNANGNEWDKPVTAKYFEELKRVSKNQIVWGGNYYDMGPSRGFIVWNKPEMRIHTMSDCEFAWTSFDRPAKILTISRGFKQPTSHPTEKPVKLYKYCLKNYAKPGDKILDTHLGSGSIALACHQLKFDLTGFEIDKDYFDAAVKRLKNFQLQGELF